MPTSNGQVQSRDLQRGLLKNVHFPESALIESDFIQDQAVTFPDKIDDPTAVESFEDYVGGVGLTTSWQNTATATLDIPAWADSVTIFGTYFTRIIAGSNQELFLAVLANDPNVPAGAGAGGAADSGERETVYHPFSFALTGVAGSTLSVYGYALVSTGSTTADFSGIECLAVLKR